MILIVENVLMKAPTLITRSGSINLYVIRFLIP
jgi:hypothetical protein